jgi:protein phosphatase PTC7
MLRRGSLAATRVAVRNAPHVKTNRRTFFSRSGNSKGPSNADGPSSAGHGSAGGSSNGTARALTYFLDAHAACRNKRCRVGAPANGIVADPEQCGEDSYFMTPNLVGVADGVGGWNENGVDPGEISRSLMRNASTIVKSAGHTSTITTQEVLARAYAKAVADEKVEAGSTTACIVRLKESSDGRALLEYTNLGDSGFALIRDGAVIFRSKFQVSIACVSVLVDGSALTNHCLSPQYYGRAPYQLAKIPPRFKIYGAIENKPSDVRIVVLYPVGQALWD